MKYIVLFLFLIGSIQGQPTLANSDDITAAKDRANHTGTQDWDTLTGTPTTLAGYGIVDAAPTAASVTDAIGDMTDAQAAASRDGMGAEAANQYDKFLALLTDSGLYADLVDGVILQATYNTVTAGALPTIRGNSATVVGGGQTTGDGMSFNGSTQRLSFPITASTAGTVVAEMRHPWQVASQYAVPFAVSVGTAYSSGVLMQARIASGTPTGAAPIRLSTHSGGGDTYSGFTSPTNPSVGLLTRDPIWRVAAFSNDGAGTVKIHVDGQSLVSSGSQAPVTVASTLVTLGSGPNGSSQNTDGAGTVYATYNACSYKSFLFFNRELTTTEIRTVQSCLRVLDSAQYEFVVDGDSTAAINAYAVGLFAKASVCTLNDLLPRSYRVRATGIGGITAASLGTTPERFSRFIAHEKSKGGIYVFFGGHNDITAGSTAAVTYAAIKTNWANAKALGLTVIAATLPANTNWDAGKQTIREDVNALILGDTTLYDACVRRDLLLPDDTDTSVFSDGTHCTSEGYSRVAYNILSGVVNPDLINLVFKVYADDAAADADTSFPTGGLYTVTGSRVVYAKP